MAKKGPSLTPQEQYERELRWYRDGQKFGLKGLKEPVPPQEREPTLAEEFGVPTWVIWIVVAFVVVGLALLVVGMAAMLLYFGERGSLR